MLDERPLERERERDVVTDRFSRPETILAVLVVVGAVLRFSTLGVQSYWDDEGFTVAIISHGFGGMLSAVHKTESTPPLYYILAWGWRHLFGTGPAGLRSFSALLGTLAIPVSYAAASQFFSRRVGLICAAFVSVSPLLVWYSQEARAYSLLLLLGTLSLWFFARALRGDRRALAWWAVTSALAIATHYFALFTVGPEAAWLVFRAPRERTRWAAAALPAVTSLALLPLLVYQNQHVARPWTAGYNLKDAVTGVTQGALVGPTWTPLTHRVGVAALAVLVIAGLVLLARDPARRRQARVPAGLLAASVGVPLAIALVGTNYVVIRNVILDVPLGLAIVAAGVASAQRRWVSDLLVAAICAIGLAIAVAVPLTGSLQRIDWRDATRTLASPPAARIWVFLDRFDSTPVSGVYVPHTTALSAAVPVQEIALVGRAGFPGALTPSVVPGFRLVERRLIGGLWISRFRASQPVAVTPGDFRGLDARVVVARR